MILMGKGLDQKTYKYHVIGKSFFAMILLYLLFHLFLSERSIPSLMILSHQESALENKLSQLQATRDDVFDRVTRLRPETLDQDLVEEYSIEMLGHKGGDSIIMLDESQT